MSDFKHSLTNIGQKIVSQKDTEPEKIKSEIPYLTYIASGEGRIVFRLHSHYDNAVIKFAGNRTKRRGGIDQNKYESFLWNNSSSEKQSVLAPVIESHNQGLWLVIRYAEPVPEDYDLEPIRDRVYELFGNRIDSTFRRRNFGIINGEIKLIDYGYTMKT